MVTTEIDHKLEMDYLRKRMKEIKREALIERIFIPKDKRKDRSACIEYAELKRPFRRARNAINILQRR